MRRWPNYLSQRLPTEVLEHVIESVGFRLSFRREVRDWRSTLYSCALVCHDLFPKSRVYLYREVWLYDKRKANNFMNTITTSPYLGKYVRRLRIDLRDEHEGWIYKAHQVLPPLLSSLCHLEYYRLPSLHPLFLVLASRFRVVTSLRLHGLQPRSFREIVRILNGFKDLKRLEIECVWNPPSPQTFFCRSINEQEHTHRRAISFHLCCPDKTSPEVEDVLHWTIRRQSVSFLEEFSLECDTLSTRSRYLSELVQRSSGNLRTLGLYFKVIDDPEAGGDARDPTPDFAWLIAIASCKILRDLRTHIHLQRKTGSFVKRLLALVPSSICSIALYVDSRRNDREKTHAFWEALDSTFTSSRFADLTSVDIRLSQDEFSPPLLDNNHFGMFKLFLPRLYELGTLWCGYFDSDVVYPITKPALALWEAGDKAALERLSRKQIFNLQRPF